MGKHAMVYDAQRSADCTVCGEGRQSVAHVNPYAASILDHTAAISRFEWARADCARLLVESLSPAELRHVCQEELGTSHRNVIRWSQKATDFPERTRDPLWAYRSHDRKMLEVARGVW